MNAYWTIPQAWIGETCFILARGPSLRGFDATVLREAGRIIVINDSYRLAPWADVLYGCDRSWWRDHIADVDRVFSGLKLSIGTNEFGVKRLRNSGPKGLETCDRSAIRHGANSGYQAINVGYHFGASRIVLLGYDMHVQGGAHFDSDQPDRGKPLDQFARMLEHNMLPRFPSLVDPLRAAGVEVINATPGSALKCWPHQALEEILANLKCAA